MSPCSQMRSETGGFYRIGTSLVQTLIGAKSMRRAYMRAKRFALRLATGASSRRIYCDSATGAP